MVVTVNYDVLDAPKSIICHQVNCVGIMPSGLSRRIAEKFPKVYDEYANYCDDHNFDESLLGSALIRWVDGQVIASIFAQVGVGNEDRNTNYRALWVAFQTIKDYAHKIGKDVAIPYMIGCGDAGGDWEIVERIINKVFNDYIGTIYKKD